jgi:hypothetical protein
MVQTDKMLAMEEMVVKEEILYLLNLYKIIGEKVLIGILGAKIC